MTFEDEAAFDRAIAEYGPGIVHRSVIAGAETDRGPQARPGTVIHQVVPAFWDGDAIGNYARYLQRVFREAGYRSELYAGTRTGNEPPEIRPLDLRAIEAADAVVYHHAIGSGCARLIAARSAARAVLYHNVTPDTFYRRYDAEMAMVLRDTRSDLRADLAGFDRFVADSSFNATELATLGLGPVDVMPVVTDFAHFDVELPARATHTGTRWLYVGRIVPNKRLDRLIRVVDAARVLDPHVHLRIAGRYDRSDPYVRELEAYVAARELEPHIRFSGFATDAELAAAYRQSDAYVSLSEHEGFCVPLVEAMFFDLPILALAAAAVPETLGPAGLLVEPSASLAEIAALAVLLASDEALRARILDAQRRRRKAFMPNALVRAIRRFAADLTRR